MWSLMVILVFGMGTATYDSEKLCMAQMTLVQRHVPAQKIVMLSCTRTMDPFVRGMSNE